jgi:hypothetical protein
MATPSLQPSLDFGRLKPDHVSCNSEGNEVVTPISQRVRKHREVLREAGMRPVQLWVPDTRAQRFAEECHRQCLLVAQADAADAEVRGVLDAALEDLEGWTA